MIVKSLGGCLPTESLPGATVESGGNRIKVITRVPGQVGAFRKVLPQQTVGVLVRAALPGAVRVAEVDRQPGVDAELCVLRHLRALVPCQGPAELRGQRDDRSRDGVANGLGAMPGQRGAVLDPRAAPWSSMRGERQQHRESGRAFHQGPDGGAAQSDDQVTFPVSWHRPVCGFGGALADQDVGA